MTNLNKLSLALAMVASTASVAPAHAFSFAGGYDGPVTMVISGVDQGTLYANPFAPATMTCLTQAACDGAGVVAAAGAVGSEDSWGIFKIVSINQLINGSAGAAIWTAGTSGEYLVGSYGGLVDQLAEVTGGLSGFSQTTVGTGGTMSLYLTNSLTGYDSAVAAGAGSRVGTSVTGVDGVGQTFLTANFSGTINYLFTGDSSTSQYSFANGQGSANGFLDITGGDYEGLFRRDTIKDNNVVTNYVDIGFATQNLTGAAAPSNWTVGFSGNVNTNVIPEPATLALLGMGLIGLASMRRRA